MKANFLFVLFLSAILLSCKSEIKKSPSLISEEKETIIEQVIRPVMGNSSLPRLYSNGDKLFMSWVEKKDALVTLKYSFYKWKRWVVPKEITSGTDWFVNWADFPAIAENNGNILTNILQKSANGTYTYDVKLNLYNYKRSDWKNNFLLNLDGTKSEHGFVSILPYKNDSFFVNWLDGRTTVNVPKGEEQMTLRGAMISKDGEITNDILLDNRVCDCCQTSATMTPNGPVVVYRDRSQEEIRDIGIVRWEDGVWTSPKIVSKDNWYMPGCPVNGPASDAFNDNLAVVWFTAEKENPRVQIAFSDDRGNTFGMPVRVDNGNAFGRVDIAMFNNEDAVISWMEPKGEETLIQILKVSTNGTVSKPITITKTSAERASGFPQLELLGDKVFVAWTSLEGDQSTVKIASVLLEDL